MYKAIILSLSVCLLSSCGSSDGSNDVDTSNDATQPSETDNIPTRESRLVFSINLTNENADQLHSIRPDGSDLQLLDPQAPGVEPDFSHSGNDIAFSISDIRIMPATGGEHTVLTFPDIQGGTYDTYPVWSPDGRLLAFQTEDQASLVIYDSADGSLTPVLDTLGRNIRGMSWQTIPVN